MRYEETIREIIQEKTKLLRRPLSEKERSHELSRRGIDPDLPSHKDLAKRAQNEVWGADVTKLAEDQGPAGHRPPRPK